MGGGGTGTCEFLKTREMIQKKERKKNVGVMVSGVSPW